MKSVLKVLLLITPLMAKQSMQSNLDILNDVSNQDTSAIKKEKTALDLEDEKFASLQSSHSDDKTLPQRTLILAQKHIDAKEYILSQYYVKEYLRNYSADGQLDKAWFLGIQSLFLKFKISESQEALFKEILRVGHDFENTFSESIYKKEVHTILNQAILLEYNRNNDIANYYDKIGKPKAAAFYRAKNSIYSTEVSKMPRVKEEKSNLNILNDDTAE